MFYFIQKVIIEINSIYYDFNESFIQRNNFKRIENIAIVLVAVGRYVWGASYFQACWIIKFWIIQVLIYFKMNLVYSSGEIILFQVHNASLVGIIENWFNLFKILCYLLSRVPRSYDASESGYQP